MLTLWYVGDHKDDGLLARVGYALIRLGQVGQKYGRATHCEALIEGDWWAATIAGASLRDGAQVRVKPGVALNPAHWVVLDVPLWDGPAAARWFDAHQGTPYSMLGAAASASMAVGLLVLLLRRPVATLGQWCSRALGDAAAVDGAEDMSVSELMAVALALPGTRDVTADFFGRARPLDDDNTTAEGGPQA